MVIAVKSSTFVKERIHMVFSSTVFLFLPSLGLCVWGELVFVFIMALPIAFNWALAMARHEERRRRKRWLVNFALYIWMFLQTIAGLWRGAKGTLCEIVFCRCRLKYKIQAYNPEGRL
jgi:D-alanyl-lipoteichoic acid acyltransferase DltB (MBOAT superfamily)